MNESLDGLPSEAKKDEVPEKKEILDHLEDAYSKVETPEDSDIEKDEDLDITLEKAEEITVTELAKAEETLEDAYAEDTASAEENPEEAVLSPEDELGVDDPENINLPTNEEITIEDHEDVDFSLEDESAIVDPEKMELQYDDEQTIEDGEDVELSPEMEKYVEDTKKRMEEELEGLDFDPDAEAIEKPKRTGLKKAMLVVTAGVMLWMASAATVPETAQAKSKGFSIESIFQKEIDRKNKEIRRADKIKDRELRKAQKRLEKKQRQAQKRLEKQMESAVKSAVSGVLKGIFN